MCCAVDLRHSQPDQIQELGVQAAGTEVLLQGQHRLVTVRRKVLARGARPATSQDVARRARM
jgi:hypothetical protein